MEMDADLRNRTVAIASVELELASAGEGGAS